MAPVATVFARRHAALWAAVPALLLAACGAPTEPGSVPAPASGRTAASEAAPQNTPVGPRVRISQVYGGGGNTGASFRNDFVELYNSGDQPQSLGGWSVQYAAATTAGLFSQNSPLALPNVSLAPGQYFLIQFAGGANGSALPTPDTSGTINLSATAGKVILANVATGLACNGSAAQPCNATQLGQIVDLVGYGNANFFEGAVAAGPTTPDQNRKSVARKGGGAQDTNNNSQDFEVLAEANPRNRSIGRPAVASVVPVDGATNVAVNADVSVTFTRDVAVNGAWFTISCPSGPRTAVVTGGPRTFTLNPDTDFGAGETCSVTIVAARVADAGNATATMVQDFTWSFATAAPQNSCDLPFTPAYTIQGSALASPIVGQVVSTKGVVVGDYEAQGSLRGIYVQDATGDGDATTSDGIFVFTGNNQPNVAVGDVVRVTGTVQEFQDQTQLGGTVAVQACGTGSVQPVDVQLPFGMAQFLERFEGMLVRLPQALTVTEIFQLGRFGQVTLASGGRLPQPTNVAAPGSPAQAQQALNDRNRIILDDASQAQNPDPIVFARGGNPLSAGNTLRGGDQVSGVVGVMTYTWGGAAASPNAFRVRPVGALGGTIPNFQAANPRPGPATVNGSLKVASFNLLNYFNTFSGCTNGVGGPVTDCRGANNATEFSRQRAKTIAAILALGADVVAVNELENDGYGAQSASQDLVNGLNAATAAGTWAFIDADARTGQVNALGSDAIKVGFLYRPAAVTPVGRTAALNSVAFVNGGDGAPRSRPALAQAFERTADRARVVLVANHFKSKGSACDAPDAGDGQGDCNQVRVNAATALRQWLATDPTELGEPDVLILGDLNSYAKEDPITVLRNGGYTDLVAQAVGAGAYSFAFDGQWGYLDHALASSSLASQVAGVLEYHINADEPIVLDYNTEFKSAGQQASLYAPDAFRASDHDPVLVGLDLVAPPAAYPWGGFLAPVQNLPAITTWTGGWTASVRFSLGGNRGTGVLTQALTRPVACTAPHAPVNGAALAPAASPAPLAFTAATGAYTYFWGTDRAWAGSCRELVLRLADGSQQRAVFQFR
ncbi:MAG: ExeM/NucH family extracellular endonuclease [Gemmatimonadales bacterium]|nr:ExeM/NucH family extracellular endonuclease [Gemmatimonadales bacterium]